MERVLAWSSCLFHSFFRTIQRSVKETPWSMQSCCRFRKVSKVSDCTKGDVIVCFLGRTAGATAYVVSESCEPHLPSFSKIELHFDFSKDFRILCSLNPPSQSYFSVMRHQKCPIVKFQKTTYFSKCSTLQELQRSLERVMMEGKSTERLLDGKQAQTVYIARELQFYLKKWECESFDSLEFMSISDWWGWSVIFWTTSLCYWKKEHSSRHPQSPAYSVI